MRNGRLKTEKALSKITTLTHTTKKRIPNYWNPFFNKAIYII